MASPDLAARRLITGEGRRKARDCVRQCFEGVALPHARRCTSATCERFVMLPKRARGTEAPPGRVRRVIAAAAHSRALHVDVATSARDWPRKARARPAGRAVLAAALARRRPRLLPEGLLAHPVPAPRKLSYAAACTRRAGAQQDRFRGHERIRFGVPVRRRARARRGLEAGPRRVSGSPLRAVPRSSSSKVCPTEQLGIDLGQQRCNAPTSRRI